MKISEFELIQHIRQNQVTAPVDMIRGIGDDCAVIKRDENSVFLISTDCLIEKVHFDLKYFSFLELGKKAMSVNLSDIAAMGGVPRYVFITLGLPPEVQEGDVYDLYTGLQQVASEFSTAIVGGDTSSSPKTLFISLTVVGVAENGKYKLRSTARAGDGIYVSSVLGSSTVGLNILQKKKKQEIHYIQAHKNPRPRIAMGQMLAEFDGVHAMIDVSDGLVQDLGHILNSSHVAAEIHYENVPHEEDFEAACQKYKLNPEETLLTGGEDYQLLFTMDDSLLPEVNKRLGTDKRYKITRIGQILPKDAIAPSSFPGGSRLRIYKNNQEFVLKRTGFDHFLTSPMRS